MLTCSIVLHENNLKLTCAYLVGLILAMFRGSSQPCAGNTYERFVSNGIDALLQLLKTLVRFLKNILICRHSSLHCFAQCLLTEGLDICCAWIFPPFGFYMNAVILTGNYN